jgi:2-succinyl-6-hydroxy-2,4-cyclohexadiene-1-carboxylate synthase
MIFEELGDRGNPPVIFLHGFTGSFSDWQFLFQKLPRGYTPYAIDLVGHGKSSIPSDPSLYSAQAITKQMLELIDYLQLDKVILAGYSMGGRAALAFALEHPHRLKGLILESSTAGIIDESQRQERRASDFSLADFIEHNPLERFVDYWMNLPLFASQKKLSEEVYAGIRQSKMKNSPRGLANSLRGFSTGIMPQMWDKLQAITCRTLLISGELDAKFTNINAAISRIIRHSVHEVIEGSGHNTHLEKPVFFLNLLYEYLTGLLKES